MRKTIFALAVLCGIGLMAGCEKEETGTQNAPQDQNVLKGTKWKGRCHRNGESPCTYDDGEEYILHWWERYFIDIDFETDSNTCYTIDIWGGDDGPYCYGPQWYGKYTYHSSYAFSGDTGRFYSNVHSELSLSAIRLVNPDSIEIESNHGWIGFSKVQPES